MQEHQVTAAGQRHPLPQPFFVLATQNPIEMEGTYPLPEAQLDRFMFNVVIDYLPEDQEVAVVQQTTAGGSETIEPLFNAEDVQRFNDLVRKVPAAEDLVRYACNWLPPVDQVRTTPRISSMSGSAGVPACVPPSSLCSVPKRARSCRAAAT